MPKRTDIKSILIIGSGPIVIGQACEFDYSGTQACRVLKKEGYRIILANSNPATIMTDPEFADATYIEPLTVEFLKMIIQKEKPDVLLPTLGGQTALNLAMDLEKQGVLERYSVEMIGAQAESIEIAEDRARFKEAMQEIGLSVPISGVAHSMDEAKQVIKDIGLPVIIRPAYILGGKGTGIAKTMDQFFKIAELGLIASPVNEILIEQSIAGWKEYELELMRDHKDNQVVICSIENVDPMGVHTGDSITVAPAQTLTDVEYQEMRDSAFKVMRRVGVATGGSNVQFAVNPKTGEQVVIEMNPRVSRSSALASKATGFPIAKIAALLAVGYTLDEIQNDITKKTPASFEPSIDYVVTKIPRWAFEKFPETSGILGTQMQSVGEVMAIGRTFSESLQKGLRSLELGFAGLNCYKSEIDIADMKQADVLERVGRPTPDRILWVEAALRGGISVDEVYAASGIDPWFLHQMVRVTACRVALEAVAWPDVNATVLRAAKRLGFSDVQLAYIWGITESGVREKRKQLSVLPTYKAVDTCAAEFEATTSYFYSTYEEENESHPSNKKKVMIIGSGPNRIGQGIEFDYSCVHASYTARSLGYESIMVNCNPETVSTDYDTSDKLYFEPLTDEDVANIIELERPDKIIVALGGQTPLKLAQNIDPKLIAGTSPEAIDRAEDREAWSQICKSLKIAQPDGATVHTEQEALKVAEKIGYPVLVRPSYVLGGRAMEVVHSPESLEKAVHELKARGLMSEGRHAHDRPILIDRFLVNATEVDLDLVRDRSGRVVIGGIMEHIEEAGIHSGDSACILPPQNLSDESLKTIRDYAEKIAAELDVIGLLNIQFAIKDEKVYVIEANPRASRTVPYLCKATGMSLAKVATRVTLGETLQEIADSGEPLEPIIHGMVAVKEAVTPFNRFPDSDIALGPEMKSTGEVMGMDRSFELAYMKSQLAAWRTVPKYGVVFVSVADKDKDTALQAVKILKELGFAFAATTGTADFLEQHDMMVAIRVAKIGHPEGTDAVKLIHGGAIQMVINSPRGRMSRSDGRAIRQAAGNKQILCYTSARAGLAAARAIQAVSRTQFSVTSLQDMMQ